MFKLGRRARKHSPVIPHFSRLRSMVRSNLAPLPDTINYLTKLPDDLGMMWNDQLGDCTCAAFYHARQIWTGNASSAMVTEPNSDVLALYEQACGYNPSDPSTDQGGVEQDVLHYLSTTGAPIGPTGDQRDVLLASVELDVTRLDDLKRAIFDCGVAYIGVTLPTSVLNNPTATWDLAPGDTFDPNEGHAIVLGAYDPNGFTCISWGQKIKITNALMQNSSFLDEAYGLADAAWIAATGFSPMGMNATQLEQQMQLFKEAGA